MNHWLNVITLRFQHKIRLKSKCRSNSYLWKYCRKLLNSFHNFFIHPGMSNEYGPSHSDIGAIHMLNKMWNKIKVCLQYFEHKDCGQNLNFDFNMYQDRNIIKFSQWFIILLRNFHRKDCVRRAVYPSATPVAPALASGRSVSGWTPYLVRTSWLPLP